MGWAPWQRNRERVPEDFGPSTGREQKPNIPPSKANRFYLIVLAEWQIAIFFAIYFLFFGCLTFWSGVTGYASTSVVQRLGL